MDKLDVEEALKLTDGGPAFARAASSNDVDEPGMSLLDWFAGQALTGLVVTRFEERPCADYARHAYDCADAMLAERERREHKALAARCSICHSKVDLQDPAQKVRERAFGGHLVCEACSKEIANEEKRDDG